MTADNVAMLMLARALHGAAVGSIVVAGAAALLDLRPLRTVRSGQLSGVAFNVGISTAILGSALLAEYLPHPVRGGDRAVPDDRRRHDRARRTPSQPHRRKDRTQ